MKPALTPQQQHLTQSSQSGFRLYKELAVGDSSVLGLLYYELCQIALSNLPGLMGFGLRSLLYPPMLAACGRRPAMGRGIVMRRPGSIELGNRVLLDDYSVLDVRGGKGRIHIGDFASIGRFTSVVAKEGEVRIENGANIGSYCRIATQSKVSVGESTLVAAFCYIGPGNHQEGDNETPLIAREMDIRGGVSIGKHCWLGAHVTIIDGVTIGEGSIIGAHSFVRSDIPPNVLAAGVPAKVIRELK